MSYEGWLRDNDPQPDQLLQYLPIYKVVICTACKYAIQPNAISRHLKDIHKIHRGRRRPFMEHVSKLDLDDTEIVVQTTVKQFPVPLLPIQDGLRCEGEGCGHFCVSQKRMKSHWMAVHNRPGQLEFDWTSVPLQTFFRGNLLRYFTNPSGEPSPCESKVCADKVSFVYSLARLSHKFAKISHRSKRKPMMYFYHPPTNSQTNRPLMNIITTSLTTGLHRHLLVSPPISRRRTCGKISSHSLRATTPFSCTVSWPVLHSTKLTSTLYKHACTPY